MTNRSRWLALIAIAGLVLGMGFDKLTLSIVSLSVLIWIFWVGVGFWFRTERELRHLKTVRNVHGSSDTTGTLWAGREVDVSLEIHCSKGIISPQRVFRDIVPENLELISNQQNSDDTFKKPTQTRSNRWKDFFTQQLFLDPTPEVVNQVTVDAECNRASIEYRVRVLAPGEVVFPGLRVYFKDPYQFFQLHRVLPLRQSFRVLPSYSEFAESSPIVKNVNALPQHGIHRQPRSGIGFELLELREYMTGDPPKSIAWKASARRDKLMTRQYESEIPVRVQLLIDGSPSTRIGGFGQRLFDQMTHVAASIAHASVSVGDAIGSYLIDEHRIQRLPAVGGNRGFYKQLQSLADFSVNREPLTFKLSQAMLDAAFSVLGERFPELIDPQVNPVTLNWFSLTLSQPKHPRVQLAAAMAEIFELSAPVQVQMIYDDVLIAKYLQRFLCDSGLPWMAPIVSEPELELRSAQDHHQLLARAVTMAVSHAHDNEVFVILADLLCNPSPIQELSSAIQLARAKHHRVAVICPSPTFLRPHTKQSLYGPLTPQELRLEAEHVKLRELVAHLKRTFGKMNVPIAVSGQQNAIPLVLSEIAIARNGRLINHGAVR